MKIFFFTGIIYFLTAGELAIAQPILVHEANVTCNVDYVHTQNGVKGSGRLIIKIFGETRYSGELVSPATVGTQLAHCLGVLDLAKQSVNMVGLEKGNPNISEFIRFESEGSIEEGTLIQNDWRR